jgi:hypothetical protein
VALLLFVAAEASAEWDIAWLDKLSGPGPFRGWAVNYRFHCLTHPTVTDQPASERRAWLKPWEPGAGIVPPIRRSSSGGFNSRLQVAAAADAMPRDKCRADKQILQYSTIAFTDQYSKDNVLVIDPARDGVTVRAVDFRHAFRVDKAFDVMFGGGIAIFTGEGDAFDTFAQLRLALVDARWYPLAHRDLGDSGRYRWLMVGWGVSQFVPGFAADAFCGRLQSPPCAQPFEGGSESVLHLKIGFDLSNVL